ncbi:glycosyltransferase family 4 protein [Mycolicibacterium duvalii]|uniref:Glycosyl transferase n=1 Tax=Mycolicibacterium duvalii TaxID=39688 RepID=A0A7I7K1E1_9MYCO|nr:glycosyltransferase family 4 protein [Mycolicibacterium duvalii]BBX17970.1 hypothetical protein MDUV_28300 [Mycolicibacterium duvalii]
MTERSSEPDGDLQAHLRFAFLTELYHPHIGGQEVFFQELAEAMVRRGHAVDVYCIGHEPSLAAEETVNGVRVHRYPSDGGYQKPLIPALRRSWSQITRYSAHIRKVAETGGHDFYLLNQWPLMHVLALPGRVRPRSAVHWCEVRESALFRVLQARLPKMVGSNFAVSTAVAETIAAQSGRPFAVLPSGIEVARYRSAERAQRSGALYLGRLFEHKNLPLLVDAFAIAAAKGLPGELVIAGDGPARAEIEAHVARSPIADRVRMPGSVSEEQKIDLMSRAAVLGMPSKREGFPRVITEAMASGLPIVTARFPENGAKEVVAQYGSGVVCDTTPDAFAEALLATQTDWDEYSKAGLAGAQSLDWSGIAADLERRAGEVVGHGR